MAKLKILAICSCEFGGSPRDPPCVLLRSTNSDKARTKRKSRISITCNGCGLGNSPTLGHADRFPFVSFALDISYLTSMLWLCINVGDVPVRLDITIGKLSTRLTYGLSSPLWSLISFSARQSTSIREPDVGYSCTLTITKNLVEWGGTTDESKHIIRVVQPVVGQTDW